MPSLSWNEIRDQRAARQGGRMCPERARRPRERRNSRRPLRPPLHAPPLLKTHQNLDRAVDRCYRREKFETERERVEFSFGLYEGLTRPTTGTQ